MGNTNNTADNKNSMEQHVSYNCSNKLHEDNMKEVERAFSEHVTTSIQNQTPRQVDVDGKAPNNFKDNINLNVNANTMYHHSPSNSNKLYNINTQNINRLDVQHEHTSSSSNPLSIGSTSPHNNTLSASHYRDNCLSTPTNSTLKIHHSPIPSTSCSTTLDIVYAQKPSSPSPSAHSDASRSPEALEFGGRRLTKTKVKQNDVPRRCTVCAHKSKVDDTIYECDHEDESGDRPTVCRPCSIPIQGFNTKDIQPMHKKKNLYFIYNDHQISGPYTTEEIISLYVKRKIKLNKLWITRAAVEPKNKSKPTEWHKLQLSAKQNDIQLQDFLEAPDNIQFKKTFPEIYENLIENVISRRIEAVDIPKNIPSTALEDSKYLRAMHGIGTILTIIMWIIVGFHMVITYIIGYFCCWQCMLKQQKDKEARYNILYYVISYSGMILLPFFTTIMILFCFDMYHEIQSWMISYIIWGTISYITTIVVHTMHHLHRGKQYGIIGKYLLLIIGVELEGHGITEFCINEHEEDEDDMTEENDDQKCNVIKEIISDPNYYIAYIFPALASFLPAAICGFISNFILEEKFVLNCNENIAKHESSLCFESYGCCRIQSSYDFESSYAFIGGLASNILAIWATIRIIGFLMVNVIPSFALYAKRTHRG